MYVTINRWLLPLCCLALAACAASSGRVPLYGEPGALAGEWSGRYVSEETGRSGTIVFRLTAGQDTARGDVVMMVPRTAAEAPGFVPASGVAWQAPMTQDARVLTIRFVQVEGGLVRGRLDPYSDPACSCMVETVFEGALQGDVITGTFVTRQLERTSSQRGRWQVTRR